MDTETPRCVRCYEDFPIATKEQRPWQMGLMWPVTKLPKRLQKKLHADPDDIRGKPHLCGNCYFDLTDDDDYYA